MVEAGAPRPGRIGRRAVLGAAMTLPVLPALAGCTGSRGSVRVAVSWSGWELARFRDVLAAFTADTGIGAEAVALGEDIVAVLGAKASGAPDVVMMPRPGLIRENEALLEAVDPLLAKFPAAWLYLAEDKGGDRLLGVPFKAANKSVLWYRKDLLRRQPATLPGLFYACNRLIKAGQPPLALGAADGWPLSDLFENILLAVGPGAYRALSERKGNWRHRSVHTALTTLGDLLSKDGVLAGGPQRALITQFEDSLLQVFEHGEAAMVIAPDFAYPVVERYAGLGDNVGFMPFPGLGPTVVAGGDIAVLPKPGSQGGRELIKWLATPEAARPWASRGGFLAPFTPDEAAPTIYPDERLGILAGKLQEGFVFDLSDELGSVGAVLLRALQDFLNTVGGRADRVEGAAAAVMDQLSEAAG